MKWWVPAVLVATGVAFAGRRAGREEATRFRADVRRGMAQREAQLREVLAADTRLTLPGERIDGARAIEGR
ncbi:hypothetical protein [Flexivirga lutea]